MARVCVLGAVLTAGCGGDDIARDAAVAEDAGVPDATPADAALDGAIDASIPVDAGQDAGVPVDGSCEVTTAACGEQLSFTPTEFCTAEVRACFATCATPGCYSRCTAWPAPRDCYYCVLTRTINCEEDWCPAESAALDCCLENVCHHNTCCACDTERAASDECFARVWGPNCRDIYYEQCFTHP